MEGGGAGGVLDACATARTPPLPCTLPHSIPSLFAVWLACRLRGSAMVIDWHNFGYSMLSHGLGPRHPLVAVARVYERAFARMADGHICVTQAMQGWLRENWGVR